MRRLEAILLPGLPLLLAVASCSSQGAVAGPAPRSIELPDSRPLRAAFLVVDGVYGTELTAPFDVLQHTAAHSAPHPGIEVFTVSPDGAAITSAEGLEIVPDYGFTNAPAADILVVPSAEHSRDEDLENPALIDWVAQAGGRARLVVSFCWGSFVLAKAGLLDGHAATTFPTDYERLSQTFPKVDVRFNVSFVHDGRLLTSQGGIRSYDAAMYLVERLFGREVAVGVGEGLLIPWPPKHPEPFISDSATRIVWQREGE